MGKETRMPLAKRIIREAFLSLLKEENFNKISVTDICIAAEIARGTFYSHYVDKFALLEELETESITGIIAIVAQNRTMGQEAFQHSINKGTCHPVFIEYFRYIKKYRHAFEGLFAANNGIDFKQKLEHALTLQRQETRKTWGLENTSLAVDATYRDMLLSSAYVNLFMYWIEKGMNLSEEELGRIITKLWRVL